MLLLLANVKPHQSINQSIKRTKTSLELKKKWDTGNNIPAPLLSRNTNSSDVPLPVLELEWPRYVVVRYRACTLYRTQKENNDE
mmetsp:Transcript_3011/g.7234  ORF Transcript_3011/g.7234 Transcript_3011/m.7234 type:complete len:84 (-) Transcript_3011:2910-3161(-)